MRDFSAIVLAGGMGKRMGADIPKQFLSLGKKTVLWHTLRAFEESVVEEVVLVISGQEMESFRERYAKEYGFGKVKHIVSGGKERYDSVYEGLKALEGAGYRYVAIHDGARPLVSPELIARSFESAKIYGACVTAVPLKDSIKQSDEEGFVQRSIEREKVWAMQTPQTFDYVLCKMAYDKMMQTEDGCRGITDDAMVLERFLSKRAKICEGDYRNIKITTPEDLFMASAYLAVR